MEIQKNKNNIWAGKKDLMWDNEFIGQAGHEFKDVPNGEDDKKPAFTPSRRDFLKVLGFGIGTATLASCEIPVKKAIPYVIKPEEITPGVANYYASSFVRGGDYCSIVVKTREGRPIKIEGNKLSQMTKGGTSAVVQAEVLNLYNTNRLKNPKIKKADSYEDISWDEFDNAVSGKLSATSRIRIVTNTIISPSRNKVLADFSLAFPNTKVVTYDSHSSAAILIANELSFGRKEIPGYKFDKADVIVSFNADFLGTWISPIEYSEQYSKNRKISDLENPKMSRHIQIESFMSLTGSNADNRILVKPSELGSAILALYNELAKLNGEQQLLAPVLNEKTINAFKELAVELNAAKGNSLVVSASNNTGEQVIINKINSMLGNYGSTINFSEASYQRQGDERDMFIMIDEIDKGNVDAVIFLECNPIYDFAGREKLKALLDKVEFRLSLAYTMDETSNNCEFIAPVSHMLESWGDAMPKRGYYSLMQPAINTIFDTRQAEVSMLKWAKKDAVNSEQYYYDYIRENWKKILPVQSGAGFNSIWDKSLKDGVYYSGSSPVEVNFNADISLAASKVSKPSKNGMELAFFECVNIGNGQYAENPWLQEMPNPVDRTTWGNHLHIPVSFDGRKNMITFNRLEDGDRVRVKIDGTEKEIPVVSVFGIKKDTFAVPLGYGRTHAGLTGSGIGVDFNDLLPVTDGLIQYYLSGIEISEKTAVDKDFAQVQYHHTIGVTGIDSKTGELKNADESALPHNFWKKAFGVEGFQGALTDRSVIFNSNLKDLKEKTESLKKKRKGYQYLNEKQIYGGYDDVYAQGHHWGMHIDTNLCTGCGACTIACMAENNVPVVGKHEVHRHHEMSWLRIDRYFYGDVDNPNTVYQPMLCQHCDNAPCENVCPVNATQHSKEGLNQMIYNRCIGTRYCANNCPYKVRRFNWLDYSTADIFRKNEPSLHSGNQFKSLGEDEHIFGHEPLTRMVLNPDVTVRVKGVIEKCSFCVQRLQEGKLRSKTEGRKLRDDDVVTACQAACPTKAIVFGDMNDPDSKMTEAKNSPLAYIALEETNVRSSISYSMKVNNRDEKLDV